MLKTKKTKDWIKKSTKVNGPDAKNKKKRRTGSKKQQKLKVQMLKTNKKKDWIQKSAKVNGPDAKN